MPISTELKQRVYDLYASGKTLLQVSQATGVGVPIVREIVRPIIRKAGGVHLKKFDREEAEKLYSEGKSLREVGRLLGVSYEAVRLVLSNTRTPGFYKYPDTYVSSDVVVKEFVDGLSMIAISEKYDVTIGYVRQTLTSAGLNTIRNYDNKAKLDLDEDKLVELYESGKSLSKLSTMFGVSVTTIQRRLKDNGVVMHPPGTKFFVKEDEQISA